MKILRSISLFFLLSSFICHSSYADNQSDEELAYTKVIQGRAMKIVSKLAIQDEDTIARVRDIIAGHYRNLRDLHDGRDEAIRAIKKISHANQKVLETAIENVQIRTDIEQYKVHFSFLGKLGAEISPAQVDEVKNGLTYGVLPLTYNAYRELLPDLTEEQRRYILECLTEAREYAMDGGSSREKHHIFGKYKGRINNYLSKIGYDLKEAERQLLSKK